MTGHRVGKLKSGEEHEIPLGWTLGLAMYDRVYVRKRSYSALDLEEAQVIKITPKRITVKLTDSPQREMVFYRGTTTSKYWGETYSKEGRAYSVGNAPSWRYGPSTMILPDTPEVLEIYDTAKAKADFEKTRSVKFQDLMATIRHSNFHIIHDESDLDALVDFLKARKMM